MNQEIVFNQSNMLMQKNDYWYNLLYGKKYFDNSQELRQKYDYVGCLTKNNLLIFVLNEKSKENYFFVCATIVDKNSNTINVLKTIVSEVEFHYFKEFEKLRKKVHTQQQEEDKPDVVADDSELQPDKDQDSLF
jgi:hypothetical protein